VVVPAVDATCRNQFHVISTWQPPYGSSDSLNTPQTQLSKPMETSVSKMHHFPRETSISPFQPFKPQKAQSYTPNLHFTYRPWHIAIAQPHEAIMVEALQDNAIGRPIITLLFTFHVSTSIHSSYFQNQDYIA
jgi:hypothetical protein